MNDIKFIEALYIVIDFVIPGIVASYARAQILTGRTISQKYNIFSFIIISLLWNFFWKTFEASYYGELYFRGTMLQNPFSLFIGPFVFGLILGLNERKGWLRSALSHFGLHTVDPLPTAWDRIFNQYSPCWVLVTTKDGSKIGGFLSGDAIFSSDNSERDVFIPQKYNVDHNNNWTRSDGEGIYIAAGEIRFIEFWPDNDDKQEP